jgi:hypothetical protein
MKHQPLTRRYWPLVIAVGTLVLAGPLWTGAQTGVADPTRPPPSVLKSMAPPGQAQVAPPAASAPASAASAVPAKPRGMRVTLIRLDEGSHRRVALVQGQFVNVGDRIGAWVVAGIDAQGVTLRGARGAYRLWLLSGTDQEAAAPAASTAAGGEKESP